MTTGTLGACRDETRCPRRVGSKPKDFPTVDKELEIAVKYRLNAEDKRAGGLIHPVKDSHGTKYTGSTAHYEKLSRAAQRAYMAWLRDPAVQQASWDDFDSYLVGFEGG